MAGHAMRTVMFDGNLQEVGLLGGHGQVANISTLAREVQDG
jgi:hypothetical protein